MLLRDSTNEYYAIFWRFIIIFGALKFVIGISFRSFWPFDLAGVTERKAGSSFMERIMRILGCTCRTRERARLLHHSEALTTATHSSVHETFRARAG